MNKVGFLTLCRKEVGRFLSVSVQTIFAPLVSTLLYFIIFGQLISDQAASLRGIDYAVFLLPGLIMMAMLQNAFSNSSSSLIQSKMYGNLDLLLLSPLSPIEIFAAFVFGAVARGMLVGLAIALVGQWWVSLSWHNFAWLLVFSLLANFVLGAMGFLAGLWAAKYDHLAAFQNFVVLPLTFLSGVFYSVTALPEVWQLAMSFNPFFYMVDGFRYAVLGVSDQSPWVSLLVTAVFAVVLSTICVVLLQKGWKIRR